MTTITPTLRRSLFLRLLTLVSLLPGLILFPVSVQANPSGANIVHGNVNFQGMGSANLDIMNHSNRAIINWQSFSIGKGETTNIHQANSAMTLNRVVSGNPSAIYGQLNAAKGGVVVVNPNGIVVGPGGSVDVAGMLTMSTLDITNNDFLNGGSDRFRGTTSAGIANYGSISSAGGDVVLLGNFLQNAGSVSAPGGTVAFGAGGDIVVNQTASGGKISVLSGGAGGDVGIENSGEIRGAAAELKAHGNVYALAIKNEGLVRASGYNFTGGKLTLSGGSRGSVVNTGRLVARNSDGSGGRVSVSGNHVALAGGSVDASGEAGMAGGSVEVSGSDVSVGSGASVSASGSEGGSVRIAGTETTTLDGAVDAVGSHAAGGDVVVEGRNIVVGSQSAVNASGDTGGGDVRIGGGFQGRDEDVANAENLSVAEGSVIIADAGSSGQGGNVILWSDGDTLFEGDLSASGVSKGGFAEISGRGTLAVSGNIDLSASDGASGTLLLDPTDITISATGDPGLGGSTISNVWLSEQLDMGTNVVISTNFGGSEAGHITVGRTSSNADAQADRVQWYQDDAGTPGGTLSLLATGNIRFNTAVESAGEGGINVVAGWDGVTGLNMGDFDFAEVLATMNDGDAGNDAAGLFGASVFIGATDARTAATVGSRWGDTNVAGRNLILRGSTSIGHGWAQLGFTDSGVEYELSRTHNG
ncbi:MAG: filamentous hemagglutinin N-terminal domain-containing protein, partial [Verrucomicrobiales bacterium]